MKRTLSDPSPRNSLQPAYRPSIDNENVQPNSSINEHSSNNQPQFVQRSQVDRNQLFPTTPTSVDRLEAANLRLINSITENTNPLLLTDELYAQLVDSLSKQDFKTAMRIAGVNSLQKLYELTNQDQGTLLIVATQEGHTEVVKALLSKLSNPDSFARMQDKYGCTALMHAARTNNTELIKALLSGVNDRDMLACMKDNYGHTALMHAAVANEPESITTFLSMVRNPEALAFMADKEGMNALMHAAYRGYAESIHALLTSVRNGRQLAFMKNESDFNALMLAAIYNKTDSIQAILDNVKNPEELVYFPNNDGTTALMICSRNEHGFDFNPHGIIAMLETVKKIRDPDSLIFLTDIHGMNAFMIAAEENNDLAVATLFHCATDKLALLKQEDKKKRKALDILDPVLCDGLIRILNQQNILIDLQDADANAVLSLLQQGVYSHSVN